MSFRIERAMTRNSSFATPGESYVILASSASLHKHLSDSYWYEGMDQVCDGKLEGVAVRYTGDNLVMLQFRPQQLSPAGYRYPLFMSIPIEFMVPVKPSAVNMGNTELTGSFGSVATSSMHSTHSSVDGRASPTSAKDPASLPRLCVVCGRFNTPGMISRPHGWKCKDCKGKKSVPKLRKEAERLRAALREKD